MLARPCHIGLCIRNEGARRMCRGRAYCKLRREVENNFFTQLAAHIMAAVDIRARVDVVQYSSLAGSYNELHVHDYTDYTK